MDGKLVAKGRATLKTHLQTKSMEPSDVLKSNKRIKINSFLSTLEA